LATTVHNHHSPGLYQGMETTDSARINIFDTAPCLNFVKLGTRESHGAPGPGHTRRNDGTVRIYYRGLVKPRDYSGLLEGHPPLRCMWGGLGYHICIIDCLEITHFLRYNNLKGLSLLRVGATHPLFPHSSNVPPFHVYALYGFTQASGLKHLLDVRQHPLCP
jgi:hypothetical protein